MNKLPIDRIFNLLKRLEWSSIAHYGYGNNVPKCYICDGIKYNTAVNMCQVVTGGHKKNCDLASILKYIGEKNNDER